MPRISVVIPCYNQGEFIDDAVESVFAQTFQDFEIIIVNDGSTDPCTREKLSGINLPRVRVVHTGNEGLAAARNFGIEIAQGDYILPLDADDRIAPGFLELAIDILDRDSEVGAVHGKVDFFGETTGEWLLPDYSPTHILIENMIVASAVFRRTDWQLVGGYSRDMRYGWEDWDFWLSFVELGRKVIKLPQVVFYYRIRRDSMTRTLSMTRKIRIFSQLVCKHKKLYFANSWSILRIILNKIRSRISLSQSQAQRG